MDKMELIHRSAIRIMQWCSQAYGEDGFPEIKPDLIAVLEASRPSKIDKAPDAEPTRAPEEDRESAPETPRKSKKSRRSS